MAWTIPEDDVVGQDYQREIDVLMAKMSSGLGWTREEDRKLSALCDALAYHQAYVAKTSSTSTSQ